MKINELWVIQSSLKTKKRYFNTSAPACVDKNQPLSSTYNTILK